MIKVLSSLSETVQQKMKEDIESTEAEQGIICSYEKFHFIKESERGQVIGVLSAYTAFSEIYIDDLWIHSSHRNQGYGRELVQKLEEKYEGKGYNNINLCTSAFQAPQFYKKCGFEEEFTRVNQCNPKLSKTFFVKFFKNSNQNQGIISK